MDKALKIIRIFLTNWVHLVGFYIAVSLTTFINNFVDHSPHQYGKASPLEILVAAPVIIGFYTAPYVGLAILVIFLTDIVAMILKWPRLTILVLAQWLIISSILAYRKVHDTDPTLLMLIITAFFVAQMFRGRQLEPLSI